MHQDLKAVILCKKAVILSEARRKFAPGGVEGPAFIRFTLAAIIVSTLPVQEVRHA